MISPDLIAGLITECFWPLCLSEELVGICWLFDVLLKKLSFEDARPITAASCDFSCDETEFLRPKF